jgi:putative hydrolase of the HAD superfamily
MPNTMPALTARPEVIFFDVGDTLMRTHPSWAGVYRLGLAEQGIAVSEDQLARALAEASPDYWLAEGPFEASAEASFARVRAYDQQVLAALGHPDLPDDVFLAIEAAFLRRTSWLVFDDVLPAIEALKADGFRLAVISNWVWGGPELMHDIELAHHFEQMVFSARVGYQKPAAAIFEHALARMGVAGERTVHIGDNPRADVAGARRVGITPVLIDRRLSDPARAVERTDDPTLPVVADLFGLLDLLGVPRPAAAAVS